MDSPAISVCILSFNRRADVLRTIAELQNPEAGNPPLEIIVAENGSQDGTAEAVRAAHPEVRLIALSENVGIAALNRAFEAATAPLTFILDDDSHPAPGTIARCVRTMRMRPEVGAIACQILFEETMEPWRNPHLPTESTEMVDAMTFIGCGACVRTEALRAAGGYADFYFLYENEIEIGLRLWSLGHRVVFDPGALAIHRVSPHGRTTARHVLYGLRNNLSTAWMYAPPLRRMSLTLGLLLFYGKWAIRERLIKAWFQGLTGALRQGKERRRRRMRIRPDVWPVFERWATQFSLGAMLRRHLLPRRR